MKLRIAQTVANTEAEGPGKRYALWVQGCSLRCLGCCNPEMFSTSAGREADSAALAQEALTAEGVEGVSILGGEPFEQPAPLADFAERVRARGLSVMVYSGYTLAELKAKRDDAVDRFLATTDLLVDGRYEKTRPEPSRRWVGSSNQVMHFLSERYTPTDERFHRGNTVELRFVDGKLTVNGWPQAADAFRRGLK